MAPKNGEREERVGDGAPAAAEIIQAGASCDADPEKGEVMKDENGNEHQTGSELEAAVTSTIPDNMKVEAFIASLLDEEEKEEEEQRKQAAVPAGNSNNNSAEDGKYYIKEEQRRSIPLADEGHIPEEYASEKKEAMRKGTPSPRPVSASSTEKAPLPEEKRSTPSPSPFQMASLNDIQPLPESAPLQNRNNNQIPGAYAMVGGHGFSRHPSDAPPTTTSTTPSTTATRSSIEHTTLQNESVFQGELAMDHVAALVIDPPPEQPEEIEGTTELEVFDGKILDENKRKTKRNKAFLCLMVGLILVGALVVILVLMLVPSASNGGGSFNSNITSSSTNANNSNNAPILYPPYQDGLPIRWVKQIETFGSPSYYANQWMLQDPNFESYSPEKQEQRFCLATTYLALNGGNWTHNDHWMSYSVDECLWFSQSVNDPVCDQHGNYITFNLSANNLKGPLLFSDRFLPNLISYDVSNNQIEGLLPSAVNSNRLETFIVSNNNFEGQLIGFSAPSLKVIKIDGNRLWGSNAGQYIFQFLPHLEILNVTNNLFAGVFTPALKYCKNLTYIGYRNNDFHGNIPSELGLLSALEVVDIRSNPRIGGTIPTELGAMASLTYLDVVETSVIGSTPRTFCERVKEEVLLFSANCSSVQCCV